MNRRSFSMMVFASVFAASMATAETYSDVIVRQLVDQGFVNVSVEVTLLGRVRIRAESPDGLREIILNPNTGEILRDLWLDANGNPVMPKMISRNAGDDQDDDSESGDDDGLGDDSENGDDSSGSGSGSEDSGSDDSEDGDEEADDEDDAEDDGDD